MTTTTNTLIIGGGQAGLAVSRCLTELDRDHLVIERGRIAERWKSERWDSLRLLTPNWMTRLPGYSFRGSDPDGFMAATEAAALLDRYAASFAAPVHEHTTVTRLAPTDDGFSVETDDGEFRARNVVIATGWCDRPAIPAMSRYATTAIQQVAPSRYRNPDALPAGGVLVVGASATGLQLADELHASGRPVTLAVGSHSRMPRTYRGMDAFWWLDLIGSLDKTIDDVPDQVAARTEPSLQLVGRSDHRTLDLATLQAVGVRLVGRLIGLDGRRATFADDANASVAAAERRLDGVLRRVDEAIERLGLSREVLAPDRPSRVASIAPCDMIDLATAGITSIVWATGYRRTYDWLELPILDQRGEIAQYRGVTPMPGAYVLGQRFQHHRNSNFIDGVGRDARFVAEHISHPSGRHGCVPEPTLPHQK
jgi:putative flavoprotein involved in K+ transport